MRLLLFISFLVLSSCSFQHDVTVTLVVPEYHPFEIAADSEFWYTLTYFDGRTINERHIPKGTRTLNVRVKAGGLSVFSLKPLGELGSLGGFYEPGESQEVHMLSENGSFSDMLLSAASYRPDSVRRLSIVKVMEEVDDLQSIDEPLFLEDVFNGTLGYGITISDKTGMSSDTIPEGVWVSERYDVPSFEVPFSSRPVHFLLYPGVYRYAEFDKSLLLTVIITEEGETSEMFSELPLW